MKRSLRHPFRNPRHYLRAKREKSSGRKSPKQPKLHQNRFSVGAVFDAPDSTESRPNLRVRVVGIVVIGMFALLGLRLWTIQILQAPSAVQAVAANQIRAVAIDPTRGLILDRYGNPLVNNVVTEQITLSRVTASLNPDEVGRLAAVIGQTTAQVNATISNEKYSPYEPVPVLSNAPLSTVLYIQEHSADFPGVQTVETTERNYPQTDIAGPFPGGYPAAQTLGYVGSVSSDQLSTLASKGYQPGDQIGESGLEAQYESYLRGTPGQQQLEVDAKGQVAGTLKTTPAISGDNLVTNLDINLQQVADNALATQIAYVRRTPDPVGGKSRPAPNGAVVVMNPDTGAILAASSFPSYNPEVWVGGISDANYAAISNTGAQNNYVIDGQYPPGSTFKLTTATSALQSGLITPTTDYDDTGSYTAQNCTGPDCTLKDDVGDSPAGYINVSTALTVSSDSFFYKIGDEYWSNRSQYGNTPIQNTATQYGYGLLSGIDLPNEATGRVDSQAERVKLHTANPVDFPNTTWYTGDNMELAFGQGGTIVTPIQQAVAYSTFANGGTRYAPQVAAAITDQSGKVIKRFTPQVTGKITYTPAQYSAMMQGFTGVVASASPLGTGYDVFVGQGWSQATFPLAGKTGTASVDNQEPTSWFVGFGGPNPQTQYVVVCVINQGGYGADAAAPVVRNIYNYLATHSVGPAAIPPPSQTIQSIQPVVPPTSTTTTTKPKSTSGSTTSTAGGAG